MPKLKKNESEKDFIARCMPIVMNEGKTQQQALGKCYGMYRNMKKSKNVGVNLILKARKGLVSIKKKTKTGATITFWVNPDKQKKEKYPKEIKESFKLLEKEAYAGRRLHAEGEAQKIMEWAGTSGADKNKIRAEFDRIKKKMYKIITKEAY